MQFNKFIISGNGILELPKLLKKAFAPSFKYTSKKGNVFYFVFERFSFLQASDMSGSILIDIINNKECIVQVVVSGGRVGLFRLDLVGAENSAVNNIHDKLAEICEKKKWVLK